MSEVARRPVVRLLETVALLMLSVVFSYGAALGIDPNRPEGWIIPALFLAGCALLGYLSTKVTPAGPVRWIVLALILALPVVVGVQLLAFWLL